MKRSEEKTGEKEGSQQRLSCLSGKRKPRNRASEGFTSSGSERKAKKVSSAVCAQAAEKSELYKAA